ncbi:hypothetical protein SS50377_26510 [Spironucleus salmonicida]|uniref:Uncharacterized protein n=1 Tax=Spironucleus salmonicida TaxID=348837 RepID=V6LL06_9EUKA|nr:hypothetical protein SS50377_26510 [Spironucleus salmonicida]|eukprot:EST41364.1 Hypothetical protein SS50377_19079 [Spironucleus salmonicida]
MAIFTASVPTHNFSQVFTSLMKRFPTHIVSFNLGQQVSTIKLNSRMALEDLLFEANRNISQYYLLSNIPEDITYQDVEKTLMKSGFNFRQVSSILSNGSYIISISPEQAMKINKIPSFYFQHNIQVPIILVSNAHYTQPKQIDSKISDYNIQITKHSTQRSFRKKYEPNLKLYQPDLTVPSTIVEHINRSSRLTKKWRDFKTLEVIY